MRGGRKPIFLGLDLCYNNLTKHRDFWYFGENGTTNLGLTISPEADAVHCVLHNELYDHNIRYFPFGNIRMLQAIIRD